MENKIYPNGNAAQSDIDDDLNKWKLRGFPDVKVEMLIVPSDKLQVMYRIIPGRKVSNRQWTKNQKNK